MIDYPKKGLGLAVSAGISGVLALAVLSLGYVAQRQPFGGQRMALHAIALALVACMVWVALRAIRLLALRYAIREGYLYIDMGLMRWRVPLTGIQRISQAEGSSSPLWGWPGWTHAIAQANPGRTVYAASTLPLRQSIHIEGDGWSLLVSPRNATAFVQQLDQPLAHTAPLDADIAREPLAAAAWPIWHDPATLYPLAASLLGALLLYASAAWAYPTLSTQITMVGSAAATRVLVPQDAARALPIVGGLVAMADGVLCILLHRHSRVLAYLWVYGALAQQGILWVGLWRLVRG